MTGPQQLLFVSPVSPDDSLRQSLSARGFAVLTATDCERATERLNAASYDLIVVDLDNTAGSIELIKRIRTVPISKNVPVLVLGKWGTGQPAFALSLGADAYEPTPMNAARVADAVERLFNRRAAAAKATE